ncbi:putative cytochrome P450 [Rosa chinensis]|uniref:Putative cytochrome P450 n=1 Tax=Rosa chinensis TaxID=74649 RepID=A0A2P6R2B1_ROSCH|nr:cytochrome P450 CYP749A22 [Rosa chinensis]PRQ40570.1 putative cytochrome P450 [Rosa chinensis]
MISIAVVSPSIILCGTGVVSLLALIFKLLHRLWWTPTRIQKLMAAQGIRGPSYRVIHGNTKEINNMKTQAMSRPRNLTHDIVSGVHPHIHSWTNIYGKNYLQWHGSQAQLVITEPELCREILNDKERAYPKMEPIHFIKKLFGEGLGTRTKSDEKWAQLRKISNHAFLGESLKNKIPATIDSAGTMLQRWKNHEGKEIEVYEEFRLLTAEVISRTAFGSSYLEGQHIFEMLMKFYFLISKNLFTIRLPSVISKVYKTKDETEAEKLDLGIRDSIVKIIQEREAKAMRTGEEGNFGDDFLGLLLKAHHDADVDERITVEELIDECKTLYFAGQDSTASLLAWTILLLALHTDWQDEARKEVLQVFGKQNRPNHDGIAKLKTLSMIINESLRLYPPLVTVSGRTANREVRLGKLTIDPASNLELLIKPLSLHHDPDFWGKDVHLFKPERFADGVGNATNNNLAGFLPFGTGRRMCVGFDFATTEAKVVLSMILQRYSFTLSPTYVHSPYEALTLCPQHGVQVVLHSL